MAYALLFKAYGHSQFLGLPHTKLKPFPHVVRPGQLKPPPLENKAYALVSKAFLLLIQKGSHTQTAHLSCFPCFSPPYPLKLPTCPDLCAFHRLTQQAAHVELKPYPKASALSVKASPL